MDNIKAFFDSILIILLQFLTSDISIKYDYLICQKCVELLLQSYAFITEVIKSQATLRNDIGNYFIYYLCTYFVK